MKTMKKLLTSILAVTILIFSATAQNKRENKQNKGQHHGQQKKQHMMKNINMSEAQKAQAKAIRQDQTLGKEQKKEQIKAILTPEQKTKMAEMKAEKKQNHEAKSAEKMEKMKANLGLSDDQANSMKAFNESFKNQRNAIKNDASLTKEQKKEKMKALKAQRKEQRKSVLTDEQEAKMKELKKNKKIKKKKNV